MLSETYGQKVGIEVNIFFHILYTNIIPIFLLIGTGFFLQKRFHFDVKVLSKLLFNLYIPILVFVELMNIEVSGKVLGSVLLFFLLFLAVLFVFSLIYIKLNKIQMSQGATIINATIFYNCANLGIPLVLLVFPDDPLAISIQIIAVLIQTILLFTVGVINVNAGRKTWIELLITVGKIPVIYAILLSLGLRGLQVNLPEPILIPMNYVSDGYIAIALVTLGIQLANITWRLKQLKDVLVVTSFRLLVSPLLAFLLVLLFNLEGTVAQVLIISSAAPTAVNSAMVAIEYDNGPEAASQIVLTSTLISALTLPLVIMFVKFYFGT
jgi:malate permease and related proteins